MNDQERQALYAQLIGECQAEVLAIIQSTPMEERVRNDPKKLSAFVQKIVRQAMAPPNCPSEPTEQDIRRSLKSQLEHVRQQVQRSQTQRHAMEMFEALADFKLMLSSTVVPTDKEILSNAVKFLEDLPRTPEGKPNLDKKQVEMIIQMYKHIYPKVKEWKDTRQPRGQQPMEPGSVPMPPAMAPPQAPHPQAMQASPMPPMPPVNQPVAMPPPPPPPNHPHAKPMHGGVYQQPVHPQDHQQVRKPDVPPPQSCDELLTKLFKNVRNDTAVFYSTPHPPHI